MHLCYIVIVTVEVIHISITPHMVVVYVCGIFVAITLKIYFFFFTKFQVNNIVLLTIVTILYIRFLEFIYLITENLYLLANISIFPPGLHPGNPPCTLCFYEFNLFSTIPHVRSDSVCFSLWFCFKVSISVLNF